MVDCKMVGELSGGKWDTLHSYNKRVYSQDGCSPTVNAHSGGETEIKVLQEPIIYDDYNGRIKADQSCIGTVMPNFGNDAKGNGTKIIELIIAASRGRNPENPSDRTAGVPTEQRLEIGGDVSNTLTSVQKDNYVIEPSALRMVRTQEGKALRKQYEAHEIKHGFNEYREAEPRTDGVSNSLTSVQKDNYVVEPILITGLQEHQSIKADGVCNALPAAMGMGGGYIPMVLNEPQIRIRKLTPKETWRLMGFSDEDFEKAEKVNSNTQLYKQAGNSIVVNVLMKIFKEMI